MAGETRIDPEQFVEFLPFLADDMLDGLAACMGKGWEKWVKKEPFHKFKPDESAEVERAANYVVMALQMGLLLAKRQPELGDVALSILKSRGMSADEMWQGIIEVYHGYLGFTGSEHWERAESVPITLGNSCHITLVAGLGKCPSTWTRNGKRVGKKGKIRSS